MFYLKKAVEVGGTAVEGYAGVDGSSEFGLGAWDWEVGGYDMWWWRWTVAVEM